MTIINTIWRALGLITICLSLLLVGFRGYFGLRVLEWVTEALSSPRGAIALDDFGLTPAPMENSQETQHSLADVPGFM